MKGMIKRRRRTEEQSTEAVRQPVKKTEEPKEPGDSLMSRRHSGLIFGLITFATIVSAIVIPLVISVNRVVRLEPVSPDSELLDIKSPDAHNTSLSLSTIQRGTNTPRVAAEKLVSALTSESIRYLYQQEYRNSLRYNAIARAMNSVLGEGAVDIQEVSPIEELEKSATASLEDTKRIFQRRYGINNWPTEFARELATNESYGNATSEDEAIQHMVDNNLRKVAYGRWDISVNNTYTTTQRDGVPLRSNVSYRYEDTTYDVYQAGQRASFHFLANALTPTTRATLSGSRTLTALLSGSYNEDYRDVLKPFLNFLTKRDYQIYEALELPINVKRSREGYQLSLSPENIAALLTLVPRYVISDENTGVHFKGVTTLLEMLLTVDGLRPTQSAANEILPHLLLDTANKILSQARSAPEEKTGESASETPAEESHSIIEQGVATTLDIIHRLPHLGPGLLDTLYTPVTRSIEDLRKVVQRMWAHVLPNVALPSSDALISRSELESLNNKLAAAVRNEKVALQVTHTLTSLFKLPGNQANKLATVYRIGQKLLICLDDRVYVFNRLAKKEYPEYLQYLLQQYANNPDEKSSNRLGLSDISTAIADYKNSNAITTSVLRDPEFTKYILTRPNPTSLDNSNYTQADVNQAIYALNANISNEQESRLQSAFDALRPLLSSINVLSTSADYLLQGGRYYYRRDGKLSTLAAQPFLVSVLRALALKGGSYV